MKRSLILCIIIVLLGTQQVFAEEPISAAPAATASAAGPIADELEVIRLVNELRRDLGLGCLTVNPELTLAAQRHSQDMINRDYFSHTAPDPAPHGSSFGARARSAGYTGNPRGENIAAGYGSPASVFSGWENSTGHYNNMTASGSNEIGVGYASGSASYGTRWTMVLGRNDGGGVPCVINVTSPSNNGSVNGATFDITWARDTHAEWYHLYLLRGTRNVLDKWVEGAAVCGSNTCRYTFGATANGTYTLWAAAWGSGGMGAYDDTSFTVSANTPDIQNLSVSVQAQGNRLSWQHDTDASWYNVVVKNDTRTVHDEWHDATTICASNCEVNVLLVNGDYTWELQAWGPGGFGQTRTRNFSISFAPAGNVEGRTPTGSSGGQVALGWSAASDGAWYHVYLMGPNGFLLNRWYEGLSVCSSGNCTIETQTLPAGNYSWWSAAWGPGGMGNYTETTFTVNP
jgi:uncharacterized protein YkwD